VCLLAVTADPVVVMERVFSHWSANAAGSCPGGSRSLCLAPGVGLRGAVADARRHCHPLPRGMGGRRCLYVLAARGYPRPGVPAGGTDRSGVHLGQCCRTSGWSNVVHSLRSLALGALARSAPRAGDPRPPAGMPRAGDPRMPLLGPAASRAPAGGGARVRPRSRACCGLGHLCRRCTTALWVPPSCMPPRSVVLLDWAWRFWLHSSAPGR